MSAQLQEAIDFYKSGNHVMVMSRLGPLIRNMKVVDPSIALMMAQSCFKLHQVTEAAHWYDRAAVPSMPNRDQVRLLAANLYTRIKNWPRALELTRHMLRANPRNLQALALYRCCLRTLLAFEDIERSDKQVRQWMLEDMPGIFSMERPLDHLFWCADEALNARLNKVENVTPFSAFSRHQRRTRPHDYGPKIRVAYLSNDLSDRHATMRLVQGVFLAHDRSRFDIHLLCHTDEGLQSVDQGMRQRLQGLYPIHGMSDDNVVATLRDANIDILVDLKGHSRDPRLNIVNQGAAPVQVAWIGFPGVNVEIDCDYMIGDATVTPPESQQHWDARFCRMPETYQSNDDTYRPLPPALTREAAGLPKGKVVLASFNSQLKISPDTVRLWCEVMKAAPDTVLWILCDLPDARANLLKRMKKAGIKKDRVIFAEFAEYDAHVARLQAADIALDTFPCNGHTTTSDKLWAGLPLVTIRGSSFASRVSASLLTALQIPELITENEADYIALNVRLATDAEYRKSLREKITAHRFQAPLFDTERFTRHLETAFTMMVERARNGLMPEPMDVPALPPRAAPFRT